MDLSRGLVGLVVELNAAEGSIGEDLTTSAKERRSSDSGVAGTWETPRTGGCPNLGGGGGVAGGDLKGAHRDLGW
jgi:hypothetical protein